MLEALPELRFLDTPQSPKRLYSQENIIPWIKREFQSYRSLGIGGLNPALYQALFKEQTTPWVALAKTYVDQTILNIHCFLHRLLKHVCRDPTARETIWARMIPGLVDKYAQAHQHLQFLLQVERDGNLGTLNHYLADTIKKSKEARVLYRLKGPGPWKTKDTEAQPLLRLSDVKKLYQSNEDHEVEVIHDTLKSYCKVARKRFVDNVYMQIIDHLLITSDKSSPLKIFSPA